MKPWRVTVDQANELWTTAEVKNYLKVDDATDDALIAAMNKAARFEVESRQNISTLNKTIVQKLERFPSSYKVATDYENVIKCLVYPLISVTSITYLDENGVSRVLNSSLYEVDTYRGLIAEAVDQDFPDTYLSLNDVTITYVAGFGTNATDCPSDIRIAVLKLIAAMYDNRTNGIQRLPTAADIILNRYKYDWV
ncbi:MAG: hypothetical protein EBZ07_06910 [Verrucomicrobia bacterium]|nr:hypothetical protein [Verrucomicrobiota bacterium]